uniref:Uncharacterized protein n=1 Tax=Aegilops tauschii subsp. strangulata TaxID=200361 RepID=A0A453QPM4_AEGTS
MLSCHCRHSIRCSPHQLCGYPFDLCHCSSLFGRELQISYLPFGDSIHLNYMRRLGFEEERERERERGRGREREGEREREPRYKALDQDKSLVCVGVCQKPGISIWFAMAGAFTAVAFK